MAPAIDVDDLQKTFRTPVRAASLGDAMRSIVRRRYAHVTAVSGLSFTIERGAVVGLIGPNGAGKTTTMKMLSGILHPSSGHIDVLGFRPADRATAFLKRISLIRGSQPISGPADLTVGDHFLYRALLYEIPRSEVQGRIDELQRAMGVGDLVARQVRGLSLGERMRAGLALALLHRPDVVFLDEPTIGLDTTAAIAFRSYVRGYAAQTGATIVLTSHYVSEIEALCDRVLLIDRGALRFDGALQALAARLSPWKEIRVTLPPGIDRAELGRFGTLVPTDGATTASIRTSRDAAPEVTARILDALGPTDLSVLDPPLEVVLDTYYRSGAD